MTDLKRYIVWNSAEHKSEGAVFDQYTDAYWAAHGKYPKGHRDIGVPSLGDLFRELHCDEDGQVFPMEEIECVPTETDQGGEV